MQRVRHIFAWLGGALFILVCLVVIGALLFRATVMRSLERETFVTHSLATGTPETFGAPYQALKIDSHGRTLQAWAVDAGSGTPAVLLFHGDSETIHNFAHVQAYLFQHHVSSMVFDYSGFGASTGKPTIRNLNEDAHAAWRAFVSWAGPAHPKFVLGYSLGTAVALHNVSSFHPQPMGVMVYGAFSSARNLIAYLDPGMPPWLMPLVPDVWNNVDAADRLRVPLLVVAGMNDTNVPPEMGRQVAFFGGGDYVLIPDAGHSGIENRMDAVWPPILSFVRRLSKIPVAPASASSTLTPTSSKPSVPAAITTTGR